MTGTPPPGELRVNVGHQHRFEYEEWSYDQDRRVLVCECGATVAPLGSGEPGTVNEVSTTNKLVGGDDA